MLLILLANENTHLHRTMQTHLRSELLPLEMPFSLCLL